MLILGIIHITSARLLFAIFKENLKNMRKGGLGGLGKLSSRSFGGSRKSFGGSFGPRLGSSSRRMHMRPRTHHRHYGGWHGRGYYGRRRYYGRRGNPLGVLIVFVIILWIINPWLGIILTIVAVGILINQDNKRKTNTYNSGNYAQQSQINQGYPTQTATPTTAPRTQPKFVQRPRARFCKVCGDAILAESTFCSECGTKV